MKSSRILFAEDDENLAFVVLDRLQEAGFEVQHAVNGAEAWDLFNASAFDLCLVDVMMPGLDGFTLARQIRLKDELTPIIFLTARSQEEDRLKGFDIGGDDYVTKPFSMNELIYRVKVFLRRNIDRAPDGKVVEIGKYVFDLANLRLKLEEQSIGLTQREADLLDLLWQRHGRLVEREEILVKLWGENDYFKGRSLDVFISRLRKYLKADPGLEIRNHHGVGFTLLYHNFSG